MRISVITPVLNGERYIRETVESVLGQEGDFELEYIVRDGKSTDRTLEILQEFGDRLTVVSEHDGSPQQAINAGMKMATGDILAWLNADDTYQPDALQKAVNAFEQYPNRKWGYGICHIMDESGHEIRKPVTWYKTILGWFFSRHLLLCENFINQPATFWRSELWRDLDCSLKAAFDYKLWLQMAHESKAIPIHAHLATFRRHRESISENCFERQFAEELKVARDFDTAAHRLIHRFCVWKTVTIYGLLAR